MNLYIRQWREQGQQAVLLLHGLTGCAAIWDGVACRLAEAGYHVVAPDLREHGRSGKGGDLCLRAYAADVAGLIHDLHLERPIVVGHSFGAAVAWELCASQPDSFSGLVIEDHHPDAGMSTLPYWQEWAGSWPERFSSREEAIRYLQEHDRSLAWWEPSLVPLPNGGWGWAFDTAAMVETIRLAYQQDYWDRLASLTLPVLLIRGGQSTHLTEETARRMSTTIPDCRLVTVPEADHWVHRHPEPYVQLLLPFLAAWSSDS